MKYKGGHHKDQKKCEARYDKTNNFIIDDIVTTLFYILLCKENGCILQGYGSKRSTKFIEDALKKFVNISIQAGLTTQL